MSLIRWKKEELTPTLNAWWDDFFKHDFFTKRLELGTLVPAVNITEEDDKYMLGVALPGAEKKDFKIEVLGDFVTISMEKTVRDEQKAEKFTHKEFSFSSFSRTFQLSDHVDKDMIEASYKNGILLIEMPKLESDGMTAKKQVLVN